MSTLFISDLHLDAARPAITDLFVHFLRSQAVHARALYILGDLFEAWIGDDTPSAAADTVALELRALTHSGVAVFFLRGNRDFLLGADYAARAGLRILPDPCVIDLYGRPVVLQHGDLLCSSDTVYQAFRKQTRDPHFIADFLAKPLAQRIAFAQQARAASQNRQAELRQQHQQQFETITDVSHEAVLDCFQRYGVELMIHGHTHRPAIHSLSTKNGVCTRIVLGDWYEHGSVLTVNADGYQLQSLD